MIITRDAMPLAVLVDLVNGWGTVPRAVAEEQHLAFPPSGDLLARVELPARAAGSTAQPRLRELADRVYPVFAATDTDARALLVTGLLARARVRPALVAADDRIEGVWEVAYERDGLTAAAALALHRQLTSHPVDRLGTCAGTRCADAYVDASPGGHRRFCSVSCQNRNRVAAFRRRKSAAKSVAPPTRKA
ncbi:MAG: CGNR zinc finger domain-containing protein [Nocardioidaceae bacterium]